MADEPDIEGLRAIVENSGEIHDIEEPDPPYTQGASPFWKSYTEDVGGALSEEVLLDALKRLFEHSIQDDRCAHVAPAGWVRAMQRRGETEVRCPWCGAPCALPAPGPGGPAVADA